LLPWTIDPLKLLSKFSTSYGVLRTKLYASRTYLEVILHTKQASLNFKSKKQSRNK